jgi:hypothetical protein
MRRGVWGGEGALRRAHACGAGRTCAHSSMDSSALFLAPNTTLSTVPDTITAVATTSVRVNASFRMSGARRRFTTSVCTQGRGGEGRRGRQTGTRAEKLEVGAPHQPHYRDRTHSEPSCSAASAAKHNKRQKLLMFEAATRGG